MTGEAIFPGWRVHCPLLPILGNFCMTAEAKCWHPFYQIAWIARSMAIMAGNALFFHYRLMLHLVLANLGFCISVAVEANLARLILYEKSLIGAVRTVTSETVTLGERRMCCFVRL